MLRLFLLGNISRSFQRSMISVSLQKFADVIFLPRYKSKCYLKLQGGFILCNCLMNELQIVFRLIAGSLFAASSTAIHCSRSRSSRSVPSPPRSPGTCPAATAPAGKATEVVIADTSPVRNIFPGFFGSEAIVVKINWVGFKHVAGKDEEIKSVMPPLD